MAGESWQHPGAPVEAGPGNGTRILFDQPLEGPPQLDSTTGMAGAQSWLDGFGGAAIFAQTTQRFRRVPQEYHAE
jgi:hypothetical protein